MANKQNLESELKYMVFESKIATNLKFHGGLDNEFDEYQITYKIHPDLSTERFDKTKRVILGKIEKMLETNYPQIRIDCNDSDQNEVYHIKLSRLPYEDLMNDLNIKVLNDIKGIVTSYSRMKK